MDGRDTYAIHAAATRALLAGQPGQARELLAETAGQLPLQLLQVACGLVAGTRDRGLELRRLLDRCAGPEAEILLSTVDAEGGFSWDGFLARAVTEHFDAEAGVGQSLRMVGIDGAGQAISLPLPEQADLLQVLFYCPSHCGDRIYLRLCDAAGGGDALRLGAERLMLSGAGTGLSVSSRIPRLFTCRREEGRWALCLDGELLGQVELAAGCSLRLEVMADQETPGDVETSILAVEVAAARQALIPSGQMRDFQIARVRAAQAEERPQAVVTALGLLALADPERATELAHEVLAGCCTAGHAADWYLESLLAYLTAEQAAEFRRAHASVWGEPRIQARDLQVRFYREAQRLFTWPRLRRRLLGRGVDDSFLALDEVSLDVYEGDIVGIVGRNGAGKSTLLRTLSGMIPIEKGRVMLLGQHLLLSAGLGVRPELTGRENIYLGGYFMGLTHAEIATRFEEIVSFAELEHAIEQPFKFYSDGMKARLIFSMATSVSPQVLMLDELLSAGDLSFQQKAQGRMDQLIAAAGAVVVVTHGVDFVRDKCNKAIYLQDGRMRAAGSPEVVVDRYLEDLHLGSAGASDPPALAGMMARAGDWGI